MGIEIKELHIRAVVAPEPANTAAEKITPALLEKIKKEVIRECMQELKVFIDQQKER